MVTSGFFNSAAEMSPTEQSTVLEVTTGDRRPGRLPDAGGRGTVGAGDAARFCASAGGNRATRGDNPSQLIPARQRPDAAKGPGLKQKEKLKESEE